MKTSNQGKQIMSAARSVGSTNGASLSGGEWLPALHRNRLFFPTNDYAWGCFALVVGRPRHYRTRRSEEPGSKGHS